MRSILTILFVWQPIAAFASTPPVHTIVVNNDSGYDAKVSTAFQSNGRWITYGWKTVYAHSSSIVLSNVVGDAYGYAYDTASGGYWPAIGDASFCTNRYLGGIIEETPCIEGAAGYAWLSYRRFTFQNPTGTHTWTLTNRESLK